MADYSDSQLGKASKYSQQYDPSLLWSIPRNKARQGLIDTNEWPFFGSDLWTAFEISWLNLQGLPQVAIGEFLFPCSSPSIVESKSFKLYLNSYNQTQFASIQAVTDCLSTDLSAVVAADVDVIIYELSEYDGLKPISQPQATCIDQQQVYIDSYQPDANLLVADDSLHVEELIYSHLLKTNCPVTGQPDWASIYVSYQGAKISAEGLLKYIVSFRQHQDFHEQCVEQIFMDIMRVCQPQELSVYARYMRRGGLDINPFRSTRNEMPPHYRQVRQ